MKINTNVNLFKKIFILISFAFASPLMAFIGSGVGTEGVPYIITSCAELIDVNNSLTVYYELDENIAGGELDCSANGNNIMIGTLGSPFMGNFDGNNINIVLDIDDGGSNVSLFRVASSSVISNLSSSGSIGVAGTFGSGGLIGFAYDSTLLNLSSSASVSGAQDVGGLIGYMEEGTLTSSFATGPVTGGIHQNTGGLIGDVYEVDLITLSYATGDVVGTSTDIGGFAGDIMDTTVTYSYATGDVSSGEKMGGFVGDVDGALISYSYSTGNVTGDGDSFAVGGFAGDTEDGISNSRTVISNSYATGSVTAGGGEDGGFIGEASYTDLINVYSSGSVDTSGAANGGTLGSDDGNNTYSAVYWDRDTAGLSSDCDDIGCSNIDSKSTSEMKVLSTYVGWDFITIWGLNPLINSGYPFLRWEGASHNPPEESLGGGYTRPPLCEAKITPSTITVGESAALNWNVQWSTGRRSTYYTKAPGEGLYSSNVNSIQIQPKHTTTYRLATFNLWGANFCEATVEVLDTEGEEVTSERNSTLTASAASNSFFRPIVTFFAKIFVR
jgi:hypothetical protein